MNNEDLMPIGTPVFDIMRQEWGVLARSNRNKEEHFRYSVDFADEDDSESYTIDGFVLYNHITPSLSLSQFNFVTGEGEFTSITEWRNYVPKIKYADLFKFFSEEYNLTLLDGQIEDIINEVKKHLEKKGA